MTDMTKYLTVPEFAAAVGVARETISKRIARGAIPVIEQKIGERGFRYMISASLVATYRAAQPRTEIRRLARLLKK